MIPAEPVVPAAPPGPTPRSGLTPPPGERRGRGRPRSFETEAVLGAALAVFWRQGYAATSLDDLVAATGVNRPSLYAALGDKRAIYQAALARFAAGLDRTIAALLGPDQPLRPGLDAFYRGAIDLYTGGDAALGCPVLCTAATEAATDPASRDVLGAVLARLDHQLAERLAAALTAAGRDAAAAAPLARIGAGVLHSLAIRARAGEDRDSLLAMARDTVDLLVGQVGGAAHVPVPNP